MMALCGGCGLPIYDRYLLQVLDRAWHVSCVICVDCKAPLTDKCFSRGDKLYCKLDFARRFGTKCFGCDQVINTNDLVRRARDKLFHVNCFICTVCRRQMDTGDELYIVNGHKFMCKKDYHGSSGGIGGVAPALSRLNSSSCGAMSECSSDDDDSSCLEDLSGAKPSKTGSRRCRRTDSSTDALLNSPADSNAEGSPSARQSGDDDSDGQNSTANGFGDENSNGQGGTKRRGPRTTIKAKQLETLKSAFAATPKPTRHIREQLAQETGLNMRVIQVWFQNRRSKERRMKQLRFGGFRQGSRRQRPPRVEDGHLMHPNPNMFQDGNPNDFYPQQISYYCDMFGPPQATVHPMDGMVQPLQPGPEMSLSGPAYMLNGGDMHHQEGEVPHYLMDASGLRPPPQPSPGMPLGSDMVFRQQPPPQPNFGSLTAIHHKPDTPMSNVSW